MGGCTQLHGAAAAGKMASNGLSGEKFGTKSGWQAQRMRYTAIVAWLIVK
jgi:hypothetical protein